MTEEVDEPLEQERLERIAAGRLVGHFGDQRSMARELLARRSPTEARVDDAMTEAAIEASAKAAFRAAQTVYRADHDHFPLKRTWETTDESVRNGWRNIALAALQVKP